MPLTYTINAETGLVTLRYDGSVDFEEWTNQMHALLADPKYQTGSGLLVDRRLAGAPSAAFVRRLVGFLRDHSEELSGARVAMLVAEPASYGMARMLQAFAAELPMQIEVFREMDEAEKWLAVR